MPGIESPSGLARYFTAAVLVRAADQGAAVGLILLALDPGTGLRAGAAIGGLLAAALTAPHLVGPWVAQRLDRARDGRRLLCAAYLGYAVALALGAFAVGRAPTVVAIAAVGVAGCCGPLLTGGLSSRLTGTSGNRIQGWDALTYGIAGTAGPAVVAGLASAFSPLAALFGLSTAAALGAGLTLVLPADRAREAPEAFSVRAGTGLLITHGPLRRVTVLTLLTALQLGAMPLIAAAFAPRLTGWDGAAAMLTVALGLGALAGSLLVTAFPLRGDPERLSMRMFFAYGVVTALCAFAPTYPLALAGFALIGAGTATAFTATLAARSAYAPPGARAQVFVTSAGLKVAVASVGAASTGAAAGLGGPALLLIAAGVTALALLIALTDRAVSGRRGRRYVVAAPKISGP